MPLALLSIAMLILSIIFRLAAIFRLTIPLLYIIAMNTVCSNWYHAHESLAHIIFFVILGLVVLSWIISLVRKCSTFWESVRKKRIWRISSAAAPASNAGPVSSRMNTAVMRWI